MKLNSQVWLKIQKVWVRSLDPSEEGIQWEALAALKSLNTLALTWHLEWNDHAKDRAEGLYNYNLAANDAPMGVIIKDAAKETQVRDGHCTIHAQEEVEVKKLDSIMIIC